MIDGEGRLFGRINLLDLLILLVLVLAMVGYGLVRSGRLGIHKKVRGEAVAEIDCFIRGPMVDPGRLLKVGDKTFITLRNIPYSGVAVTAVRSNPKMLAVAGSESVQVIPDPAEPFTRDLVVTIRERASLTDDGIVFGDSKVKVGTPIELEGFQYRLRGTIVAVRTTPAS